MYPEFRNLVTEALALQGQLLDLENRLHTGEPTDSGAIASHDLQERLDALYLRIGRELPQALVASRDGIATYAFTDGHVPVEPRDASGERFVLWLRDHAEALDAFVREMSVA